jgi:hypothetical protein
MGTLVFVCPTTGHQVSTGVEVDRSSFKSLPRTKQRSFVRAVARTTCYLVSGLGWTAMSRRSRPTQSLGLILSSIGVGFRQRAFL